MTTSAITAQLTSGGALAAIFDPNTQATVKVILAILAGVVAIVHTLTDHNVKLAVAQGETLATTVKADLVAAPDPAP